MPLLENRNIPLTENEITEICRRLKDPNDPHPQMTKAWAVVAIEQLQSSLKIPQTIEEQDTWFDRAAQEICLQTEGASEDRIVRIIKDALKESL